MKLAADAKVRHYFSTAWLRALFPHTGQPDEFAHRLQRLHAAPFDVDGRQGGLAICQFIYPEVDGAIQTGIVKFYLPPALREQPGRRVPLLHMAGYEIQDGAALDFLKEGFAVSTVHVHPLNPLSRGPKLEWALMHAMRRLPFVDDARVMVKGISTGGNMTLLAAAETFPLACAMPIVPLFNLSYNLAYLIKSIPLASSPLAGSGKPWMPILATQAGLPEQAAERFGVDPEAPAYFELSPVRLVEYITAPALAVFCTSDMLVPIEQVGLVANRPLDAARFPDGFTREMSTILTRPEQRLRLRDVIPAGNREGFLVAVPKSVKKKEVGGNDDVGAPLEMPFSRSRQWSIAVIDDGAPERRFGHFKHYNAPDFTAFWRWALGRGAAYPAQAHLADETLPRRAAAGLHGDSQPEAGPQVSAPGLPAGGAGGRAARPGHFRAQRRRGAPPGGALCGAPRRFERSWRDARRGLGRVGAPRSRSSRS